MKLINLFTTVNIFLSFTFYNLFFNSICYSKLFINKLIKINHSSQQGENNLIKKQSDKVLEKDFVPINFSMFIDEDESPIDIDTDKDLILALLNTNINYKGVIINIKGTVSIIGDITNYGPMGPVNVPDGNSLGDLRLGTDPKIIIDLFKEERYSSPDVGQSITLNFSIPVDIYISNAKKITGNFDSADQWDIKTILSPITLIDYGLTDFEYDENNFAGKVPSPFPGIIGNNTNHLKFIADSKDFGKNSTGDNKWNIYTRNISTITLDMLNLSVSENISPINIKVRPSQTILNDNNIHSKRTDSTYLYILTLCFLFFILLFIYIKFLIEKVKKNILNEFFCIKKDKINYSFSEEKYQEILKKFEVLISENFFLMKNCTLINVAKMINTNSKYLSLFVREYTGKNFIQFIKESRIKYVLKELENNPTFKNYSIETIAKEIGFKERKSFTEAFKKNTGYTPSAYIKKYYS